MTPLDPPFRDSGLPHDPEKRSWDAAARQEEAPGALPTDPPCTFCEGTETELMNAFGSQLSVATYWCRTCRSPFEFMKWRGESRG